MAKLDRGRATAGSKPPATCRPGSPAVIRRLLAWLFGSRKCKHTGVALGGVRAGETQRIRQVGSDTIHRYSVLVRAGDCSELQLRTVKRPVLNRHFGPGT